ncbi:MAG: hypothetical protein B7Z75_13850, partial [Acidocella sp. 20-57-95]
GVSYRVFFTNLTEMEQWLKARTIVALDEGVWDSRASREYLYERNRGSVTEQWILRIQNDLFDDFGNLKPMLPGDWDDKKVVYSKYVEVPAQVASSGASSLDDEIPF